MIELNHYHASEYKQSYYIWFLQANSAVAVHDFGFTSVVQPWVEQRPGKHIVVGKPYLASKVPSSTFISLLPPWWMAPHTPRTHTTDFELFGLRRIRTLRCDYSSRLLSESPCIWISQIYFDLWGRSRIPPSHIDAEWNSTLLLLSGEWDSDVLVQVDIEGKPIKKYVVEAQLLKWAIKWVFNASSSRRKIRLWYLNYGGIPHLLNLSHSYGRHSLLYHGKPTLGCHDSPLSVPSHGGCWMEFPIITIWGVVLLLPENGHDWVHPNYYVSLLKKPIGLYHSTRKFSPRLIPT